MHYLTHHWTFGPYLVIAVAVAGWYAIGLRRLPKPVGTAEARQRRRQQQMFYGGLAMLVIATESPVDYWGYDYFFVHIIQHLLLMFAAPSMLVAGAPWRPLLGDRLTSPAGLAGTISRGLLRPWVGIAGFSVVMVAWHLPGPFDLADQNRMVHIWLMESSFLLAGVLFWLQFIGSPPVRIRMSPISQATALLITNCVMWVLSMAMGFLTSTSWYSVYNHIPGITLPAFADQQIGAGILWICGDFWAVPTMVFVIRKLMAEDGSVSSAVDRILGRGSSRYNWANRG